MEHPVYDVIPKYKYLSLKNFTVLLVFYGILAGNLLFVVSLSFYAELAE